MINAAGTEKTNLNLEDQIGVQNLLAMLPCTTCFPNLIPDMSCRYCKKVTCIPW
jgi:hypothetical protein